MIMSVIPRDNEMALINGTGIQLTSTGFFQHVFAFGLTSWLGFKAYNRLIVLFLFMITFGIVLEIIQTQIPWRSFNWYDILANIIGIVPMYLISTFFISKASEDSSLVKAELE